VDGGLCFDMVRFMKTRTIEVDETTAATLRTRAAERGATVAELVAELVLLEGEAVSAEPSEIAELDRRWKAIESGETTVANEDVVRWLHTWGAPAFRPWHDR
jgi:predicted transcriptional regulator